MKKLGVPYPDGYEKLANKDLDGQAKMIQNSLADNKIKAADNKEILALIAYLQRMGKDIKMAPKESAASNANSNAVLGN